MKSSPRIVLILIFFFSLQCVGGVSNHSRIQISLEKLGAIPNDGLDDSDAFNKVLAIIAKGVGNYVVLLPDGEINIDKPVINNNMIGHVLFEGKSFTKVVFGSKGQIIISARSSQAILASKATAKSTNVAVEVKTNHGLQKNDLIHISSKSVFETGWNYKENDIHRVKNLDGKRIDLESPLIFNYEVGREEVTVTIFKNFYIGFSNISFIGAQVWDDFPATNSFIVLTGLSLKMNKINLSYKGQKKFKHIGVSLQACENLMFEDIILENFLYGVLINFSRNVTANNTAAKYCRHAYVPSQATYSVNIMNLKGYYCNSVIDSHQSFLVNYINVVDTLASQFPNCRALGSKIENARFYVSDSAKQEVCYWSIQSLTKEYEYLYGEYDTEFYNVEWVTSNPSRMNGLTSYGCRSFIIDNCKTHNVAFYGQEKWLRQVVISNSTLGMVYMDSQKVLIKNSTLDGALFKNAPFVFKFRGTGNCIIDNVVIKNYNDSITDLFGFFVNITPSTIIFSNSTIGPLKGWTNKFIYPGRKFSGLSFKNTSFSNLHLKVPKELEILKLGPNK